MDTETGATVSRGDRHAALTELVATFRVTAQSELVDLLADRGIDVTQATVSRDLEQLGIGKLRGADGVVSYVLPDRTGLAQLLRQFVTDISSSGNLAVLRTPPAAASTVASAIDAAGVPDVLATLQGDDTVLVVSREPATGRDVAANLARLKTPTIPSSRVASQPHLDEQPS